MTLSLRPYLPADAEALAVIYGESIDDLTANDYSEEQRAAWMSPILDQDMWMKQLSDGVTLVGLLDGEPIGFAQLTGKDRLSMLYVHPTGLSEGVGRMLVDALEKLAKARGATVLHVDSSETALGFFEHLGFTAKQRTLVSLDEQWLSRIAMTKQLGVPPDATQH
jgi:putative acetyltransferase